MDYIYDILLNFQDEYYDYYEWKNNDKIVNIKRIPIYKITNQDYLNIKYNNVVIERNTIPKQSKMFLLTSGIEVMGIYIDNNGKVLKKSSLIFDEADDILEDKDEIKSIDIKYQLSKKNTINHISRIKKEKTKYVDNYLKKIDKTKDEYLLKYLYYDIFNTEEENTEIIYKKLLDLSQNNISKLYDSIKKINLELKK